MQTPIIECIPNFSEARRPEIVDQIVAAIESVEGARMLDRSSDLDHNRTVVTFAGSPAAVEEAAFRAIQTAAKLIDLNVHRGEHPRIGAADVVPFVPISGATMNDCVAIARRLGERVGAELEIPVYLYEAAATRPDRVNLESIRKGQFEALKAEINSEERKPDFGPAKVGPAGATVIGARAALIAFNVYLNSDDVELAKKIAKAIRNSSGGLRYVKGLGLLVDGRAQVSMNLTNFRETPIARVVETIRREAARYGTSIHHSELVGLIPQDALVDVAVWYTQLDQFKREQILEARLFAAPAPADVDPVSFVDALAAPTAAPGGGAAAAFAGSMGAALVTMVSGLTIGKKKYADVEAEMHSIRARSEKLREQLQRLAISDSAAFESLMDAFKLPKESSDERAARASAISERTLHAAQVPLDVAERAVTIMELAVRCAQVANLNAISDAMSGFALARAALTAAASNVRINIKSLDDKTPAAGFLPALASLEARAAELEGNISTAMHDRGGI